MSVSKLCLWIGKWVVCILQLVILQHTLQFLQSLSFFIIFFKQSIAVKNCWEIHCVHNVFVLFLTYIFLYVLLSYVLFPHHICLVSYFLNKNEHQQIIGYLFSWIFINIPAHFHCIQDEMHSDCTFLQEKIINLDELKRFFIMIKFTKKKRFYGHYCGQLRWSVRGIKGFEIV